MDNRVNDKPLLTLFLAGLLLLSFGMPFVAGWVLAQIWAMHAVPAGLIVVTWQQFTAVILMASVVRVMYTIKAPPSDDDLETSVILQAAKLFLFGLIWFFAWAIS